MSDVQKTRELPPLTIHSNSRDTLAHAEKYAHRKKLDEFLIVDIDAHVSEGMFWNEVTDRIPSNVWKYNAYISEWSEIDWRARIWTATASNNATGA